MLKIKNIVKQYHGKKILDDVSFQVHPGEIVVLLGPSGVGKSTILRLLNNLETVDAGSIELDGKALDFKKVGIVFQDFNLFLHLTVLENLTLPLVHVLGLSEQEAQIRARLYLKQFDIASKESTYPSLLSGGQKQRVALARALCMQPSVVCLDEPTSALDPRLTVEVAQSIQFLAEQNKMVLVTTHDLGLLENLKCTIYLMQHGKIVQRATTQELLQQSESFELIKNFMQGKNVL